MSSLQPWQIYQGRGPSSSSISPKLLLFVPLSLSSPSVAFSHLRLPSIVLAPPSVVRCDFFAFSGQFPFPFHCFDFCLLFFLVFIYKLFLVNEYIGFYDFGFWVFRILSYLLSIVDYSCLNLWLYIQRHTHTCRYMYILGTSHINLSCKIIVVSP